MEKAAAIITISDRAFNGERQDMSGPALREMLQCENWDVIYSAIVPDEWERIRAELLKCADELCIPLVLTTGGTGFSPRDITPEVTLSVIERRAPGLPEAMRSASMKITPRACLSREEAGIRGGTLIINLPGSPQASRENLGAVIKAVDHGIEMLHSAGSSDCAKPLGKILAVCISEKRGTPKHEVEAVEFKADYGILGDAHAGNWPRQISLLAVESVRKLQEVISVPLLPGVFAENILTEGISLHTLPVGSHLKIGTSICEVTQVGKDCSRDCEIRRLVGDCVMPREGIFTRVMTEGRAKAGDVISVQ